MTPGTSFFILYTAGQGSENCPQAQHSQEPILVSFFCVRCGVAALLRAVGFGGVQDLPGSRCRRTRSHWWLCVPGNRRASCARRSCRSLGWVSAVGVSCLQREKDREATLALEDNEEEEGKVAPPASLCPWKPVRMRSECQGCVPVQHLVPQGAFYNRSSTFILES